MTEQATDNPGDALRAALMAMSDVVEPMHEWAAGQVHYFLSQGFGPDDARAMAAAEFVQAFGQAIYRTPPPDDEGQP